MDITINPPDVQKIPSKEDLLSPTLLMFTVFYRRQEFFRCSYFVYNNYEDERHSRSDEDVCIEKICRRILVEIPRIKIYEIMWDHSLSVDFVQEDLT